MVVGLVCGEDEGQCSGGLGRWCPGDLLGEVWGELWVCGARNFGVEVVLDSVVVSGGWSEMLGRFGAWKGGLKWWSSGWIWGRKWR